MVKQKYTREMLEEAVANSTSVMGVLRYFNLRQAGGSNSNMSSRIKYFNIDTSHFTGSGWNKGGTATNRKTAEQILVVLKPGSHRQKYTQLRRAMLEKGIEHKCELCSLGNIWNNTCITLEIDHIDGDWLNNKLGNLRFLCPNCHSQQNQTNRPHKHAAVAQRKRHTP